MKEIVRFFTISSILLTGFFQPLFAQEGNSMPIVLHGYTQLRFTSNFSDVHSFSLRRLKFWIVPNAGFSQHWDFKIQTTFSSSQNEAFFLQDVMLKYKSDGFSLKMGQFVPEYSLQRFESDFTLPMTERSIVIDRLIPNGTLGVRDIGVEGNLHSSNKNFETWLGVFNGYGIKEYHLDNTGIMLTHKTAVHLLKQQLTFGYSVMYRKAENLTLLHVLPDSVTFTGNDFRYNLFAHYQTEKFQVQAEYLWASLNGMIANGYYVLTALNLGKNQLVASWNQYNDIIESTDNSPEVHLGYNCLINKNKIKLMLDNRVHINNGKLDNYMTTLQIQVSIK